MREASDWADSLLYTLANNTLIYPQHKVSLRSSLKTEQACRLGM